MGHSAFYIALIPIFGICGAMTILDERLSFTQLLGGLCIVISCYFAHQNISTPGTEDVIG